jgi:hypothetical protein
MKKIFTLLLTIATISSYAQRVCDIEVKLSSPTAAAVIHSGYPVNVSYTVKNLGPDKLMAGDTVLWGLAINNTAIGGTVFYAKLTADLAAGATVMTYNQNITFTIPTENPQANFCAFFSAFNRIEGNAQVTDGVTTNNQGCAMVNMRSSGIKVIGDGLAKAVNINATPNPANDFVTISYDLVNPETVSVAIYDMNGRQVVDTQTDKQVAGENSMQLNTSALESGLYFYEVKIGNDSKRYKLMVN